MQRTVAIEDGIQGLRTHLEQEGFQVVDLADRPNNADAIILSGLDENMLGDQTRVSDGFVINARGRQPERVWPACRCAARPRRLPGAAGFPSLPGDTVTASPAVAIRTRPGRG